MSDIGDLLYARNFRTPFFEDHRFLVVHDPCGKEFMFMDNMDVAEIDRETREHLRTCYAAVPLRRKT